MDPIGFTEWKKDTNEVNRDINSLVTHICRNIFRVPQKKEIHTGLGGGGDNFIIPVKYFSHRWMLLS